MEETHTDLDAASTRTETVQQRERGVRSVAVGLAKRRVEYENRRAGQYPETPTQDYIAVTKPQDSWVLESAERRGGVEDDIELGS
jgi:hypothetical protein